MQRANAHQLIRISTANSKIFELIVKREPQWNIECLALESKVGSILWSNNIISRCRVVSSWIIDPIGKAGCTCSIGKKLWLTIRGLIDSKSIQLIAQICIA